MNVCYWQEHGYVKDPDASDSWVWQNILHARFRGMAKVPPGPSMGVYKWLTFCSNQCLQELPTNLGCLLPEDCSLKLLLCRPLPSCYAIDVMTVQAAVVCLHQSVQSTGSQLFCICIRPFFISHYCCGILVEDVFLLWNICLVM